MKNGNNVDNVILAHLKENQDEVLTLAIKLNTTVGEMEQLNNAINTQDATILAQLQENNPKLIETILETDY